MQTSNAGSLTVSGKKNCILEMKRMHFQFRKKEAWICHSVVEPAPHSRNRHPHALSVALKKEERKNL